MPTDKPSGIPPWPGLSRCPNCGRSPTTVHKIVGGIRVECKCGVCGPLVSVEPFGHHAAADAWNKLPEMFAKLLGVRVS